MSGGYGQCSYGSPSVPVVYPPPSASGTISALALKVQDALEEQRIGTPDLGVAFFNFWDVQNELYPLIVEGMYLAQLLAGEPVVRSAATSNAIVLNSTFQPMPTGAVALMRVTSSTQVLKTSVFDLDNSLPGWEAATGTTPQYWFPIGLSQWGIYPQITQPLSVSLTYISLPASPSRPYTGNENLVFQSEYNDGFVEYAAAAARVKEGGEMFDQVMFVYNEFITKMQQLGQFSDRKASLKFTRSIGLPARVTDVTVR